MKVKAFPAPVQGGDLHVHLHEAVTAKLQGALRREAALIAADGSATPFLEGEVIPDTAKRAIGQPGEETGE